MPYLKIYPSIYRAKLPGLHKSLPGGGPNHPFGFIENEGHFLLSSPISEAIEISAFSCPVKELSVAHKLHSKHLLELLTAAGHKS